MKSYPFCWIHQSFQRFLLIHIHILSLNILPSIVFWLTHLGMQKPLTLMNPVR